MTLPSSAVVSGTGVIIAQVLLALSVIVKYLVENGRSQLASTGPASYIYEARLAQARGRRIAYRVYRYSFHLRPILALLLLVAPVLAGAALAVSFVAEMYVLFRYHILLLIALSLLFGSTALSAGIGWLEPILTGYSLDTLYPAPGVPFVQVLVAAMYGLSAVRKWRNGFANGRVLEYGIVISLSHRKHRDHIWRSDTLLKLASRHLNWSIIAKAVIVWELLVGCLLLLPWRSFNVIGVVLAAVAQMSFTFLFPRTLLPFTLAVFAGLLLWL